MSDPSTTLITNQVLTEILEIVKQSKAFAIEHAPLLAQDLVRWGQFQFFLGLVLLVAGIALLVGCVMLFRALFNSTRGDEAYFPAALAALLAGMLTTAFGLACVCNGLQAFVAPHLYVVNQLTSLITK